MEAGNARPYAADKARWLGIGHIISATVALLIDLAKLLVAGDPTFALFAAVPWFVSGGFAIGGAVTKTRCMVVTTLVLSIISAILAGILTLIQIVALFGLPRHKCYPCTLPQNSTQPFNSTLLKSEEGFYEEGCCSRPADHQDIYYEEEGNWGPDTLVYLILGLVMVALAIYSATIACLVKEERLPGMVWSQRSGGVWTHPGQGQGAAWPPSAPGWQQPPGPPASVPAIGSPWPPPSYNVATYQQEGKL